MYANNVSCRDCHDVHRAKRRTDGNELCTRCHRADTYDTETHHFHKKVYKGAPSAGALCTSCHMPGQYYMVVHYRLDHSLRVPRPDLSASIGTPNACNAAGCHADKSVAWAVQKYDTWYGKQRKPHFGTVLAAGQAGRPEAGAELLQLAQDQLRPAIARATALELLSRYPGEESTATLEKALADDDALIRHTAATQLRPADPARLAKALAPLLKDPVRAVRAEAAARLAEIPAQLLTEAQRKTQAGAIEEYVAMQLYGSDMPSGPYNLANLETTLGRYVEAEKHYRRAIEIDDQFFLAKTNLALLLNQLGRNTEAETLLREAVATQPNNAGAAFNLGLLLAEEGKTAEAETGAPLSAEGRPDPGRGRLQPRGARGPASVVRGGGAFAQSGGGAPRRAEVRLDAGLLPGPGGGPAWGRADARGPAPKASRPRGCHPAPGRHPRAPREACRGGRGASTRPRSEGPARRRPGPHRRTPGRLPAGPDRPLSRHPCAADRLASHAQRPGIGPRAN